MKEIPLTQGKVALVDDEDYERVSRYKWFALKSGKRFYAARAEILRTRKEVKKTGLPRQKFILMHRFIMNPPDGMDVDHQNHDTVDNQKENLRICTRGQNNMNQLPERGGGSQFKGVTWDKRRWKWAAQLKYNGKHVFGGYFNDESKAARAYDVKAKELFGEYAKINFENEALA